MARTTVTLRSDIPGVIARSEQRATVIVARTGVDLEAGMKGHITANNSIDTGNMLNSVGWTQDEPYSGEVVVGAEYGPFVNYGTVHPSRAFRTADGGLDVTTAYTIPARPFFEPAVEDARGPFEAAVAQLYS